MKKIKKTKKMNWFYATAVFVILGISLLSYGVYSSNISTQTITGSDATYQSEYTEDPFKDYLHIKEIAPTVFGIMDYDPDAIDQIQDSFPGGLNYYVGAGVGPFGNNMLRQTGYNDREPWNGFEVIIARHGSPTEPLYIGIRDNADNIDPTEPGTYEYFGVLSTLPTADDFYWVGSDTQITSIGSEDTWSIVLFSFNNGGFDNYWMWACSDQDPYSRGDGQHWNPAGTWENVGIDLCFRTYTIPNGGGDPPDITITATYNVIPMFFGGVSFIAAVVTGSKFYFFM